MNLTYCQSPLKTLNLIFTDPVILLGKGWSPLAETELARLRQELAEHVMMKKIWSPTTQRLVSGEISLFVFCYWKFQCYDNILPQDRQNQHQNTACHYTKVWAKTGKREHIRCKPSNILIKGTCFHCMGWSWATSSITIYICGVFLSVIV